VRKVTIFFLTASIIGFFSLIGCSKSNNNSSSGKDSIYYSPWMTITMSPTDAGDTIYEENISAPAVTAKVVSDGAVVGYLGEPAYPSTGDTTVESAIDFGLYTSFMAGAVDLTSFGYLNDFSTNNSGLLYRYVVIPGNVLTTQGLTPKEARSLTYAEITKLFPPAAKRTATPAIQ
jgi:hypothetical protein